MILDKVVPCGAFGGKVDWRVVVYNDSQDITQSGRFQVAKHTKKKLQNEVLILQKLKPLRLKTNLFNKSAPRQNKKYRIVLRNTKFYMQSFDLHLILHIV